MGKYGSERGEIRNYFSKKNPQQSCMVLVLLQFANIWEKDFLNQAKWQFALAKTSKEIYNSDYIFFCVMI